MSLLELNDDNGIVLALDLPRYRCVKPRTQPEQPTITDLVTGLTPGGKSFTITAFGSLDGKPLVRVDTGVGVNLDEMTHGPQATKLFPWSLSIGCAPHPYAILYGVLTTPGQSVAAHTPQGAVALNTVPIEGRLHAKGQLVYGVFSALPSELTVLGANDSTVYSETLQTQATEAAQFCEGYAEP